MILVLCQGQWKGVRNDDLALVDFDMIIENDQVTKDRVRACSVVESWRWGGRNCK